MLALSLPSVRSLVTRQLICSMSITATLLRAKRGHVLAQEMLLMASCNLTALASEPVVKVQHGHSWYNLAGTDF